MCDIVDKKIYIVDKTVELPFDDRMDILKILKQQLQPSEILKHADGSRIDLDILSAEMIDKLHHIVMTKVRANSEINDF